MTDRHRAGQLVIDPEAVARDHPHLGLGRHDGAVPRAVRHRPRGRGPSAAHPVHGRVPALAEPLHRPRRRSSASRCGAGPAASTPCSSSPGWITEYSLSVDNLFVFLLIMARFYVPAGAPAGGAHVGHPHRAGAARGLHRAGRRGDRALQLGLLHLRRLPASSPPSSSPARARATTTSTRRTPWCAGSSRVLPSTPDFHGTKLRVPIDGRRLWTPMLVVLISLGTTDLVFALDSIPAIFGLTQEAYIVFAANVFALLGLRQLYFLLGDLLNRLIYLSVGLADRAGLHRRQAGPRGPAHQLRAVHQRRRARRRCRCPRPA